MDSDCDKRLIKEKLNMHVKRRLKDPVTLTKIKTHVKKNECREGKSHINRKKLKEHGLKKSQEAAEEGGTNSDAEAEDGKQEDVKFSTIEILQEILNWKKMALMNDPEVVSFLNKRQHKLRDGY